MVVRVAERARASGATRVVIATDDERIRAVARARHRRRHDARRSDRDRSACRSRGAARSRRRRIVVNVQGDEPLLEPALIRGMARAADRARRRGDRHRVSSDRRRRRGVQSERGQGRARSRGYALYFSRATIPWARDAFAAARDQFRRSAALPPLRALRLSRGVPARAIPSLPPAPIERFEALEQLRALWHGYRIVVEVTRERRRRVSTRRRTSTRARIVRATGNRAV